MRENVGVKENVGVRENGGVRENSGVCVCPRARYAVRPCAADTNTSALANTHTCGTPYAGVTWQEHSRHTYQGDEAYSDNDNVEAIPWI